jgi:DNA-binding NtrC family response regulator
VPAGATLADVEDRLIAETLRRCHGDKERAAKLLGISARTLYRRASQKATDNGDEAVEAGPASG